MNKVCNLREAVERDVQDGMTIAMGCALESLIPFAASHEIIRQNRKNLTLVAPISDMQFDQLIGAGCVKKIIASWVGKSPPASATIIAVLPNRRFHSRSRSRSTRTS